MANIFLILALMINTTHAALIPIAHRTSSAGSRHIARCRSNRLNK